jgi:hypothetical protein
MMTYPEGFGGFTPVHLYWRPKNLCLLRKNVNCSETEVPS